MTAVQAPPKNGRRLTIDQLLERLDDAHRRHAACGKKLRRRYPLAPLYRLVGALSQAEVAARTGIHPRMIALWCSQGSVPDQSADRLAVGLGFHPALVWPEWMNEEVTS